MTAVSKAVAINTVTSCASKIDLSGVFNAYQNLPNLPRHAPYFPHME